MQLLTWRLPDNSGVVAARKWVVGLGPSGPAFRFRSVDDFKSQIFVIYVKNWKEPAIFWPIYWTSISKCVQATCANSMILKIIKYTQISPVLADCSAVSNTKEWTTSSFQFLETIFLFIPQSYREQDNMININCVRTVCLIITVGLIIINIINLFKSPNSIETGIFLLIDQLAAVIQ